MKTLVTLQGVNNCGKTTTILFAYKMLKAKYPEMLIVKERLKTELVALFIADHKKIAIGSFGDHPNRILKNLEQFQGWGAELILCANRSYGGTTTAIVQFCSTHKYEIRTHAKIRAASEAQFSAENEKDAAILIKLMGL